MNTKLHYGIGFNSRREHKTDSLAYTTWWGMFRHCYCPEHHAEQQTDISSAVDDRWIDFQDFADWFYDNPYSGTPYQLNKDLLIPGNKVYAPEVCCFVPSQINSLLTSSTPAGGDLPRGVSLHKASGRYQAGVNVDGRRRYIGRYGTPQEAYNAYKMAKEVYVKRMALEWQDRIADNVFDALMNWELNPK